MRRFRVTSGLLRNGLLFMILCGLMLVVFHYLIASAMLSSADKQIQSWSVDSLPSARTLNSTEQLLKSATLWLPVDNPKVYGMLGKLYQWKSYVLQVGGQNPVQISVFLEQAQNAYQKQLRQEPKRPYAWLSFMETKLQLQEYDIQFIQAFENLNRLQGQNTRLRLQKLKLMIPYWKNLSLRQRAWLLTDLKWLLQTHFHAMNLIVELVKESDARPDFCRYSQWVRIEHPVVEKICN
ncbi:hypothetical protein [Thiomicrorhabdus sp. 6S3-12]|uniref:hypothetical protein n=1 Tax=Thiomicrorhabdus sp. 6S3-12 TaxID=2819681 RepID=UPI001AAD4C69|nr:hypothetical protein [Thiomicrorhabdus sp. 6S3-12]MBO1923326.1 hypothetical protein [Thiomicrorhabdus sp. 6S3-12]